MPIAITASQQREFVENGFVVLPAFFAGTELDDVRDPNAMLRTANQRQFVLPMAPPPHRA